MLSTEFDIHVSIQHSASSLRKVPPQRTISRILFLGLTAKDDNHSSRPGIAGGLERPTRRLRTGSPQAPPYLALLRAGFCLPSVLPRARCALTAPFHPYLSLAPFGVRARRYIFCATILRVAPTGRYPAHCPVEFGLSSPRLASSGSLGAARFREIAGLPSEPRGASDGDCRPAAAAIHRSCSPYPSPSCLMLYCSSFL